jgi:hypothetical protein
MLGDWEMGELVKWQGRESDPNPHKTLPKPHETTCSAPRSHSGVVPTLLTDLDPRRTGVVFFPTLPDSSTPDPIGREGKQLRLLMAIGFTCALIIQSMHTLSPARK